jgi:hypothetical protein
MRKPIALLILVLALMVAGVAAAAPKGIPAFPALPGDWSHAEINVTISHTPHTLVLDRGKIVKVTGMTLKLRPRAGSVVTIPVSPATKVVIDGAPARLRWLNPTMSAETMRIDGGTAVRIQAQSS